MPKIKIASVYLDKSDLGGESGTVKILALKEVDAYKGKDGYLETNKVLQAKVETAAGRQKIATINKKSAVKLVAKLGDELDQWIGKSVEVVSADGATTGEDEVDVSEIPF